MKKVEFKFDLEQKVKTPFGDDGFVSMLAFDDGGKQYFVKTASDDKWFKESQLTAAAN